MTTHLPCGCDPAKANGPRCARGHALQKDAREAWEAWMRSLKQRKPAKTRAELRQLYYEARDRMNDHYAEQEVLT